MTARKTTSPVVVRWADDALAAVVAHVAAAHPGVARLVPRPLRRPGNPAAAAVDVSRDGDRRRVEIRLEATIDGPPARTVQRLTDAVVDEILRLEPDAPRPTVVVTIVGVVA